MALAGFPDIILMKKIKAVMPFILNNLFIRFLNKLPINSGIPHFMSKFDNTKKGNNDGKILFLKTFKEKFTEFKILADSVNISYPININVSNIKILSNFFIISPFLYKIFVERKYT